MQAQHKAALKELKNGQFDEKIDDYLGNHPDLRPREAGNKKSGRNTSSPPPSLRSLATSGKEKRNDSVPEYTVADVSAAFESLQGGPAGQRKGPDARPAHKPRRHPTPIPQAPPPLTSRAHTPSPSDSSADDSGRVAKAIPRREKTEPGGHGPGRQVAQASPPVTKKPPESAQQHSNVLISQPPIVVVDGNRRPDAPEGRNAGAPASSGVSGRRVTPPPIPVDARSPRRSGTLTPDAGVPRQNSATPPAGVPRPISATPPAGVPRQGRATPPSGVSRNAPPSRRPVGRTVREDPPDKLYEQSLISEKSLDEVILAYLSEDSTED